MRTLAVSILSLFVLSVSPSLSFAADSKSDKKDQKQDKKDDKSEKKEEPKDPNKGGAGVGPPTVHGCDSQGCGNNGPMTLTEPPKKCRTENGIEICN